ncbi:hypothetical protein C8R44DRAFT_880851 [Mycena epipterygia]|nr:hypothetical protein C8R44DRAFT_880851 [Mycena epipterygia]
MSFFLSPTSCSNHRLFLPPPPLLLVPFMNHGIEIAIIHSTFPHPAWYVPICLYFLAILTLWPSHPPMPPSLCVAMSAHPVFVPLEGDTLGKPKQLMQSACCKSTSMKSVTVKGCMMISLVSHLADNSSNRCRDVWSSDISGMVP